MTCEEGLADFLVHVASNNNEQIDRDRQQKINLLANYFDKITQPAVIDDKQISYSPRRKQSKNLFGALINDNIENLSNSKEKLIFGRSDVMMVEVESPGLERIAATRKHRPRRVVQMRKGLDESGLMRSNL